MSLPIINILNLSKVYRGGFRALSSVNLKIKHGEIFALLGPNGAGKTTLISIICGLVSPSSGRVTVGGHDIISDFRKARSLIGLVPQELTADAFETVWNTVNFSRGIYGKPKNHGLVEELLKKLSLWDKRDNKTMTLSGGMRRRLMIAKALSHEPKILFLDEPSAGVDVELRKSMWEEVHRLRELGVTIILTTHYIEEAEEMVDRVGVISGGEIILVEETKALMAKFGSKQLFLNLKNSLSEIPKGLSKFNLKLKGNSQMVFNYAPQSDDNSVYDLFQALQKTNVSFNDLYTKQSSLEEIFVGLVSGK